MTRRRTWWRLMLMGVTLLAIALPAPSHAGSPSLNLAPPSGPPGTAVVASGANFTPSVDAFVRWGPLPGTVVGGPVQTDGAGSVDIPFNVPGDATPGPHPVTLCTEGSGPIVCDGEQALATFLVTLPPATPPPTPSPSPTATPSPTPSPSPTPTPLPQPSFPIGAATPTPEPPPVVAVTPAPTPPDGLAVPNEEFPDLWIKGIEVTQGIQDLQNRMPLVADRRTYARVYVGVIGQPEWAPVYGALEARRGGQQVGWIWPENGPITAKLGAGSRLEVDDSLNFRLPFEWLHGDVTLTAFVYSFQIATVYEQEPDPDNNVLQESVSFHEAVPLTVHMAPLHMHRSFHPDDVERIYDGDLDADIVPPGGSATMRIIRGLYRFHPLAVVNVDDPFTEPVLPINHALGHEFNPGDCQTTMVSWQGGNPEVTDWEPFMDDPAALDPVVNQTYQADNRALQLLDWRVEFTDWRLTDDGTARVTATDIDGDGPAPLVGTPVFVDGCKPVPSGAHEMNQTLALYRVFYDWDDEEDLFVGMIDPSLPTEFGGGIATSGTDSVSMRMHDGFSSSWPWSHNGAETLAHEAGHAAGLPHVPCKDDDEDGVADEIAGGSVDLSHPAALTFPVCTLADEDPEGYYGFDVYWDLWSLPGPTVIGNDRSHAAPNKAWPLMAYQNPGWPDPYHYCRLLEHYGVPCDPTDLGIPWSEPDAAAGGPLTAPPDPTHDELPPGSTGVLGISGQLDTAAGTGQMQAGFVTDAPTPTAMDRYSGQYLVVGATHRLRVLDAGGGELASVPFEQQTPSEEPTTNIAFDLLVPSFPDAAAYQLLSGEVEIARLEVSPSAPTVTAQPISREPDATGRVRIRFPWLAADADGDPLTATVLYAPDGEHWQVLATGLTDPFFEVAEDTLPGGSAPVFQVIVMDATRAASVISGPMEAIAGLPPEVVADARSGASYPQGADVVLRATAFDPEDRMLGGDAITWASSVAGELGTGTELVVADLAAGGHTITVTATDSDGLADAVSFELLIDPNVTQPQPDPAVEADIAAIFAALAAGEDPADVIGGGPDLAVILVVAGIALILVGGVGTVLLRRRRSTAGAPPPAAPPPAASPPASPPAA